MKGLLHRLAARATGTTIQVHSDARLPFGGVGQRLDDTAGDVDAQQRLTVHDETAQLSRTGTTRSAAREPTPSPTIPQSQSVQSAPLARADADASSSVVAAFDAQFANTAVPARLIKEASVAAPREGISRATAQLIKEASDAAPREGVSRSALHSASSNPSTTLAKSSAAASDIGEPSSLMPPLADRSPGPSGTTPAALRQLALQGPSSHAAVTEEPNEVYIHIGRIEITAVHEAAAPRRRRESAPAMTLDAYLAKRGHT
jgi:hypothetical protein